MENKIFEEINKVFEQYGWEKSSFSVTKPTNIEFGEFTSNVALVSSKKLSLPPTDIAQKIIDKFNKESVGVKEIKIMGPGFINFYLNPNHYSNIVKDIYLNNEFGKQQKNNITINNEYVSANPTGFLHVAHARGAALGDSLSNILEYAGYNVIREYYINDNGNQIDRLAISIYVRYHQELGVNMELPEDSYSGIDIVWGAKKIIDEYGGKYLNVPYDTCKNEIKEISVKIMLDKIKIDLKNLGVEFDIWFSEKSLYTSGLIDEQLKTLSGIYEKNGAKWLETTKFGDDKDRVLVKENGEGTYFLSDTVYHKIKATREPIPSKLIGIWGADHIGYIKRVDAALELQGYKDILHIITIQLVKLIKDGQEMKMSKRKGTSLFMSELVDQVGRDTTRFFLVNRSNNSSIEFDLDLANLKTNDNPIFIIQYAHARICQLLVKSNIKDKIDLNNLHYEDTEFSLINLMNKFPELIIQISNNYKVHLLSQYLIDLAREFNSFYSNSKIIGTNRENELLCLSIACGNIIKIGLKLLGISAPERM
ncbi:MAG: arginine--tRNA ligase [Mycoplasma sp.]|nr:arginine--tRNA ligase [Mycoplasma sp.]